METYTFFIVVAVLFFFIILFNCIYFGSVLPFLTSKGEDGSFKFRYPDQLRQVDLVVSYLAKEEHRPWYYIFLKHVRLEFAVLLALEVILFALA